MMNIDTAREILQPHVWTHPRDYGGFSPDGDYCILSQSRDSPILDQSNYTRLFADLRALPDNSPEDAAVYDWRAGHWAVGWVEYLMVSKDAPEPILIAAAEALAALADYPVYDESDYSERQWNAMHDYWAHCSISERVTYCQEARCSIFAARRADMIPEQVHDRLSSEFA